MASPSSQRSCAADIPEEDLFIAANGGEARVVARDCEVEYFVAVGFIGLDQTGRRDIGGGFSGVVEVDSTV